MKEYGFQVPLHRSLTEVILMGGAPREVVLLNGTLAAAMGLALHLYFLLILNVIIHMVAVAVTKRDPQFFNVFKRHINQKKYYGT
jgi:type IV secretory pathway TrbD component